MKLLIRIPPTPRGCGFPAHAMKVYGEYRDESLYNTISDLADGDICCVIEQLPCIHSVSIIAKIVLQDGRLGFVLLSKVPGSIYSLTELSS